MQSWKYILEYYSVGSFLQSMTAQNVPLSLTQSKKVTHFLIFEGIQQNHTQVT